MRKTVLSLLAIFLVMPVAMHADGYDDLWKKVEDASKRDLPKTQIGHLEKIVAKAEKDRNYGQLLKAEWYMMWTWGAISPDSLSVKYTSLPGKKVPIKVDMNVAADFRCVINGATILSTDSVIIYSDQNTLSAITSVSTKRITATGLTDTLAQQIEINPIPGAKIVPNEITVKVPVEPLINKKQNVTIDIVNAPMGVNVITFPSVVEASFLVPQSIYRKAMNIKAAVNYNDIAYSKGASNLVAVKIVNTPTECRNVSLAVDSVEYIVEKH